MTAEEARAHSRGESLSVEGELALAAKVTRGSTRLMVGVDSLSPDPPERFRRAVQLALREADGVMIISHTHFNSPERWSLLRDALTEEPTSCPR